MNWMSKKDRQINLKRKFYEISQSKVGVKENINYSNNKLIPTNKIINNPNVTKPST